MDEITLDLIDRLYREKYDFLFKYAKYVFGNRSIAEEAVHETFIVACIYHEKLQASLNPEGWMQEYTKKQKARDTKNAFANE